MLHHKSALALLVFACLAVSATAGPAGERAFANPIVRGSYPDPSICRTGDDFYLVNSSFEYVPGLPIHHSRDLVNWTLIGYGLHAPRHYAGEVNLVDVQSNGGIHAPSIRCRNGRFYIITTNVYSPAQGEPTRMVNFVITATDPAGPWSTPHVIDGAPGIDPDIFFDDDGTAWYVGNQAPADPEFNGQGEIWVQQLDTENWRLVGERHLLWRGACDGTWAEGPHIYKRDGRYYLLIAEGGTGLNHAVMIAVADDIRGPYLSNARNPILTARHLSYDFWVNSTGHADLVELADGRSYMVTLGKRNDVARNSNMGRETHLVPVVWEREPFPWKEVKHEWPVAAPDTGRVERFTPLPFADRPQHRRNAFADDFDAESLNLQWNFRRAPLPGSYSLSDRPGYLRLHAKPEVIAERGRASLMGFRQTESDFEYSASLVFAGDDENVDVGISLVQKDNQHLLATVTGTGEGHSLKLTLTPRGEAARQLASARLEDYAGAIILRVVSTNGRYRFSYSLDGGASFTPFADTDATHVLSLGSYTGAYLGLYATANGRESAAFADFDWVRYVAYER